MDRQFSCYHNVYNPPSTWWGFTGTENEKASRQQEYQCKWSKFHISSWRMPERAWYTSYCWCLQPAQGGSGCGWPVSNQFWYAAHMEMQLVSSFLLESEDSSHHQPYNLSRSSIDQRVHCESHWFPSLHCAWPSASWKSINNERFLPHSGFTDNHSVCSPQTHSALPPLPTRLVAKHTPLPLCQKVPGMHSPLWMESRVDCFLCRWRRSQSGSGEGMKTNIKCEDCNEVLCFTPKQNCFHEFHHN